VERQRGREAERQRGREAERQRGREAEAEAETDGETDGEILDVVVLCCAVQDWTGLYRSSVALVGCYFISSSFLFSPPDPPPPLHT
jgi:hypothetical protein